MQSHSRRSHVSLLETRPKCSDQDQKTKTGTGLKPRSCHKTTVSDHNTAIKLLITTAQPTYLHSLISVQPPRATRSSSVVTQVTLSRPCIFFSKNHQSLISLCITSSLESTSCLIPQALHKTPCWWCHTLFTSHLLTTVTLHHTFSVSFQAQSSPIPQIFSTIVG